MDIYVSEPNNNNWNESAIWKKTEKPFVANWIKIDID